ncbi:helicase SKI2W-like [Diaphorina citri]|uniref:Helicase SKI2W-like n=1 Tax=Diaphorina citri TaxID=121845 RepID=A0A3Q0JD83_DIACI|nr:helicase SKI2W-like [Diaphorina citri]
MASDATTLEAKRNPITGELIEFCEVPISGQELTAKNSMSWERAPEPFDEENITGHSTNKPFWPGGFAEPEDTGDTLLEDVDLDFKNNLLVDPPGYYGLNFQPDGRTLRDLDKELTVETTSMTLTSVPNTGDLDDSKDLSGDEEETGEKNDGTFILF